MKIEIAVKWGTVGIMALSILFFFLPYYNINGYTETIINFFQTAKGGILAEGIIRFAVPVALTLIAALIMVFRFGIIKCGIASVLCVLAVFLYFFGTVDYTNAGIGLIGNITISIAGIILPVVNIFINKLVVKTAA